MSEQKQGERTQAEEGQALLEFALVATLLFMLIFATIDFGRLIFAYATMSNGVREGARYAIVHAGEPSDPDGPNNTAIKQRTLAMMVVIGEEVNESNITINYLGGTDSAKYPPGCTTPHHCRVQVIATVTLDVWTPILPEIPLETRATMHFE